MTCPNSTADGCRCVEHHPGLGYHTDQPDQPIVLQIVTPDPRPAPAVTPDDIEQTIGDARRHCRSCQGDPTRCQQGTGAPRYDRLPGCTAWTTNGHPAVLKALPQPRQPWEPRPSRRAA